MSSTAQLLDAIMVASDSIKGLDRDELLRRGQEHGVICVRGLVSPDLIVAAKGCIRESLDIENDHASTGESPEDLYSNHQKLSISGGELRANAYPQCVRTYYNPVFAEDTFGMREAFRAAARLRNLLMGFELDFAVDRIEDGFWTAARVHHYPRGGGFMGIHCEDYVPKVYEEFGLTGAAYFQPLIVMSKKGTGPDCDFEFGGGYFERDGTRHYFEAECELGDLIAYDTRVMHGVTEIDPKVPFRQSNCEGRYAGFVTMYRDFSQPKPAR